MKKTDKKISSYKIRKEEIQNKEAEIAALKNELLKRDAPTSDVSNNILNVANVMTPASKKIFSTVSAPQTLFRIGQDISTYKSALLRAENIYAPSRTELYRLYKTICMDAHCTAVMDQRKSSILSSEFVVMKNGVIDKDKSVLLKKKYFYDVLNLMIDSIFFGFSLIQFSNLVNDEWLTIEEVPREYVKPEPTFQLVSNTLNSFEGTSFVDGPYAKFLIGVGNGTDLGLLSKLAPLVIYKNVCLGSYTEYCSMFGIPVRTIMTDDQDPASRAEKENFLRNMGQSAYAIFGKDDKLEFAESKGAAGAAELFDRLIERCNGEMSKLVLLQTSTSDQKSYVGSSQVHMKVQDRIFLQDKVWIENILSFQFIPFMKKFGFDFEGCSISVKVHEEIDLNEKWTIDSGLLQFYKIPASYITATYGTPVEELTPAELAAKKPGNSGGGSGGSDMGQGSSPEIVNSISDVDFKAERLKRLYRHK